MSKAAALGDQASPESPLLGAGPGNVAVWHSVRQHSDTSTPSSRATLGLPDIAMDAL
jgi:hypothetical protein